MKCKRCGREMVPKVMDGENYYVCDSCKVRRKAAQTVSSISSNKASKSKKQKKCKGIVIFLTIIIAISVVFILFPTNKGLTAAKFEIKDSLNASGDKIGEYGYVGMSKPELKKTSQKDFKKFIESHVSNSGLDYVSVVCGDGTGIVFPGSSVDFAEYGYLDLDTNTITSKKGDIDLSSDGNYSYTEIK